MRRSDIQPLMHEMEEAHSANGAANGDGKQPGLAKGARVPILYSNRRDTYQPNVMGLDRCIFFMAGMFCVFLRIYWRNSPKLMGK